jgi:hypothetical protein
VPLTKNYLLEWGNQWFFTAPSELLTLYQKGIRTPERKQVILLSKVLADEINLGYHDIDNIIIKSVNGNLISSIEDLIEAVENNQKEFHEFEDIDGNKIVLKEIRSLNTAREFSIHIRSPQTDQRI